MPFDSQAVANVSLWPSTAYNPDVDALSPEQLREQTMALRDHLMPLLPEIDPGDLVLILQSLLRPIGSGRRFFLRRLPSGAHVP